MAKEKRYEIRVSSPPMKYIPETCNWTSIPNPPIRLDPDKLHCSPLQLTGIQYPLKIIVQILLLYQL